MSNSTLYEILNIDKDANETQIKTSYKKLALRHHPDREGGSEEEFKKVGRAYDILSDEKRRKIYDELGEEGLENMEQHTTNFNPHELFEQLFAQQNEQKLHLIHAERIDLKDLYLETQKEIKLTRSQPCKKCNGKGTEVDDSVFICNSCDGKGIKITMRQVGPMLQQMQNICSTCKGKGNTIPDKDLCKSCSGEGTAEESFTYKIPLKKKMSSNYQIREKNKGHKDKNGNQGDLVIVIKELEHPVFKRMGNNLLFRKKITLAEALCGTKFIIDFIDEKPLLIRSKLVVNPLKTYKLVGWGMEKTSDLIIEFDVKFPTKSEMKPEFKKHIKKFLKYTETELDTAGLKSTTLIEMDDDFQGNVDNEINNIFGGNIPINISNVMHTQGEEGQPCAQQ